MKYHPLARTAVYLRAVGEGSCGRAGKWVKRYRELGVEGLADRASRPRRLASASVLMKRLALCVTIVTWRFDLAAMDNDTSSSNAATLNQFFFCELAPLVRINPA
jgi:hypothetical protein